MKEVKLKDNEEKKLEVAPQEDTPAERTNKVDETQVFKLLMVQKNETQSKVSQTET